MTYSPRKTTQSELPALAQLWYDGWQTAHAAHVPASLTEIRTLDSFEKRLAAGMNAIRVIGDTGTPLGFCMVKENEIYQIFVAPEAKGTGAAKILMQDGLSRIKAAGHPSACLDVNSENARAIAFYEKMGWERQNIRTILLDTLGDPYPLPCLLMTIELS
ncbi:N-acetyltransferase [Amylibacter sp. SFDW26]|uniref:GNAT family N-acetyltransferase n=1 Tax=Amylibacter sp. SFDW26 TaxID=2652722 RepID=UPI00186A73CE|nr:GNAT family N-acetyltransferase [Amylibacter sp. SFDW26]